MDPNFPKPFQSKFRIPKNRNSMVPSSSKNEPRQDFPPNTTAKVRSETSATLTRQSSLNKTLIADINTNSAMHALPTPKNKPRFETPHAYSTFRKPARPKHTIDSKSKLALEKSSLDFDSTILTENAHSDAEFELAYSQYLQSVFAELLLNEAIETDKTGINLQLAELVHEFQNGVRVLEKTEIRINDISVASEHEKLLQIKNDDCNKHYEVNKNSDVLNLLGDLTNKEQSYLDRIETKNVDLGYNEETGHKQLSDALKDALFSFEDVQKRSDLNYDKVNEYVKSHKLLESYGKSNFDLEELKKEFETIFPLVNENILIEGSEKIAKLVESDDENE